MPLTNSWKNVLILLKYLHTARKNTSGQQYAIHEQKLF